MHQENINNQSAINYSSNYQSSPNQQMYYSTYQSEYPSYSESSMLWTNHYASFMAKESQQFYVPKIDSPVSFQYTNEATFKYSEYQTNNWKSNENVCQSSPKSNNSYNFNNYSYDTPSLNSESSYKSDLSFYDSNLVTSLPQSSPYSQKSKKVKKTSKKQLLSDDALDIMNLWFDDHVNSPYPTTEEKERMAEQGGITVKQVTAWFSNRRNRTQNTKPKRMKRSFDNHLSSVFAKIVQERPDKQHIIDEFKSTIISY